MGRSVRLGPRDPRADGMVACLPRCGKRPLRTRGLEGRWWPSTADPDRPNKEGSCGSESTDTGRYRPSSAEANGGSSSSHPKVTGRLVEHSVQSARREGTLARRAHSRIEQRRLNNHEAGGGVLGLMLGENKTSGLGETVPRVY